VPRKSKAKPKADLVAIGRRIRELRAAVLQDDFAPELGITQGQLSKIERGVLAPSVDVLLRLRERFRKSVDWILRGE
jgi:transcriptional regulator with XRE-family HTH domain